MTKRGRRICLSQLRPSVVNHGSSNPALPTRLEPHQCHLSTSARDLACLCDKPRQPVGFALASKRENHAGLLSTTKRRAIRRLATGCALRATPINHTARIIRLDIGILASTQARSARYKVRKIGWHDESLPEPDLFGASLSAINRHSSAQIERLRATAGLNGIPHFRQRDEKYSSSNETESSILVNSAASMVLIAYKFLSWTR